MCVKTSHAGYFSLSRVGFSLPPPVCVWCVPLLCGCPRDISTILDTLLPLRVPLVLTFSFLNIYINHFFAKNLDVGPCTNPYVGLPSPLFLWFLLSELRGFLTLPPVVPYLA